MRRLLFTRLLIAILSAVSMVRASVPEVSPRLPVLFERNTGESAGEPEDLLEPASGIRPNCRSAYFPIERLDAG